MSNAKDKKQESVSKPLMLYFLIVCIIVGVFAMVCSAICYGIVHLSNQEEKNYIANIEELSPKAIAIVPGTAVQEGVITAKAKDRLLAAIELYEKGLVRKIVVSGDVEETPSMSQYLMAKGVAYGDIGSDEHGVDTYDTLARVQEKYGDKTYYFCTQELYVERAQYLMNQIGLDGSVICVDTMYYNEAGKSLLREYFAATKAVLDPLIYRNKPKKSIKERDFIEVPPFEENPHVIYADEVERPDDYQVTDINPKDNYDVKKAVEYACRYALDHNPEYPVFEENCTNFVSQCLVAGGISMQGEKSTSKEKRYTIADGKKDWYSISSDEEGKGGSLHYSTTNNFINTNAFIEYFTKESGYELSVYPNDRKGKLACLNDISSGDVLIFFGEDGEVLHIGLVTGIGKKNVYYCGNTNDRRDYGAFKTSQKEYAQFGILHMSGKEPN